MDDASPTGTGADRRRFLQLAAVGTPVAALALLAAPVRRTRDFPHRGHRIRVTRQGRSVAVQVDGRVVLAGVRVRNDGVLSCPDLLPYSDAEWGTDARALARRLVDGNGVDYVLF